MLFINVSNLIQMDKISNECLEVVLYVGLKDEEVAVGNTRKYCDGRGGSVFRPCLEVLTIDLIHD